MIIDQNNIHYNESFCVYLVKTNNGVYKIDMSGKGTCDCAAKTNCYHILAVKLFCGHKAEFVHQPINLTNLMKHKNLGKLTGSKKRVM